jgi:UDP-3-O-[3-hydroxymyristoyl] glucosamine N-acyltransferase
MTTLSLTLSEVASIIDATLVGDPDAVIHGVATLSDATDGRLSFFNNPSYKAQLKTTKATAVILTEEAKPMCPVSTLVVKDPYYANACIAKHFEFVEPVTQGIHPSAVIGANCQIAPSASIGPNVVLGDHVTIGEHTELGPNVTIGSYATIGAHCRFLPRVNVYHHVTIGARCVFSTGAVIGADGFGYAQHEGTWHKVPQVGSVEIGHDVEVGANTTIDRGALGNTKIGNGVKLDNLIQIAHNVELGDHTVAAAFAGVAGSTKIGKHCMLAAGSGVAGHLTIADGVVMAGRSMITKSIAKPGIYCSGVGFMPQQDWRKSVVRFRQLDSIAKRLKTVESELKKEEIDE